MSFPTSSIPAILFLNFADDALQVTSPKAPFCVQNFSWRLRLCSLEENATLLQLCGARWRKLRSRSSHVTKFLRDLLASVDPKKNNESKQADQLFKSSSKKFAHLVAKARWSARRKGDWKEIAELKAKYSILDLPLPACAAAVSFVATLFAGVDLQGSDGRGVSQLPICADTLFFFLLNECSLSQNECLWSLQTNFYRTFGRFVSALIFSRQDTCTCVQDQYMCSGSVINVHPSSSKSMIFLCTFPAINPGDILTWNQPEPTLSQGSKPGFTTLTLRLPTLTDEQRARFSEFDVEWRAVGGAWQSTVTPASSSTVTLPQELAIGSYEVRVRAKSSDGSATSEYTGSLTVTVQPSGKEVIIEVNTHPEKTDPALWIALAQYQVSWGFTFVFSMCLHMYTVVRTLLLEPFLEELVKMPNSSLWFAQYRFTAVAFL